MWYIYNIKYNIYIYTDIWYCLICGHVTTQAFGKCFPMEPDCGRSHPLLEDPPVTVHFVSLVHGIFQKKHEGKHERPTVSKSSSWCFVIEWNPVIAHRTISLSTRAWKKLVFKGLHKEVQLKRQLKRTQRTQSYRVFRHVSCCVFFICQRVQELQALTLTQACNSKITKYSDLSGFSKAGKLIAWIWL